MVDFSHLKKHAVQGDKPRKFTMVYGDESVTLHCLPAGESNKDFWNAVLRKVASAPSTSPAANDKTAAKNRIEDAKAFAKYCLVGWDEDPKDKSQNPMLDAKGKVVPFSDEAAESFLLAVAEHAHYAFDELRTWIANERNFTDAAGDGGVELGN